MSLYITRHKTFHKRYKKHQNLSLRRNIAKQGHDWSFKNLLVPQPK